MSEEYHVIAISLFGWETCTPKNLSELKTPMTAAIGYLVSNHSIWIKARQKIKPKLLPYLGNEADRSFHNITYFLKEDAGKLYEKLAVKEAFRTDFAIELVSTSPEIFDDWINDYLYSKLIGQLTNVLFWERFTISFSNTRWIHSSTFGNYV